MNNRILVFESRHLSYGSSHCFLQEICREFKKNGFEVEYCPIEDVEAGQDLLGKYLGRSFRAILDINSVLPVVRYGEAYYLDLIQAPFYNFIVDHPLHLHERLLAPLKNYHAICLDQRHGEYIRINYPHIKDVFVMPFGGLKGGDRIDFKKRRHTIVFPGTYVPLGYYWDKIKNLGGEYPDLALDMIEQFTDMEDLTIDEAYIRASRGRKHEITCSLAEEMNHISYIDRYIREFFREKAITELLKAHIPIEVMGINWELYDGRDRNYIIIRKPVDYGNLPVIMADTKVVFNIQPLFTDCPHDRVMNAFMNGAAVFSDTSSYLNHCFTAGEDWIPFQRTHLELLPEKMEGIFLHPDRLEEIAGNGYEKAVRYHTWHRRVGQLLDYMME